LTIFLAIFFAFLITNRTITPFRKLSIAINKLQGDGENHQIINYQKDEIEKISEYIWQLAENMKRQNEEIKLEQKTLNAVLNQMTDAVLIVDGQGFVQLANPAAERMFSLPKGKYKDKTIVEVLRNHQLFDLWKDCVKDHQQTETTIEVNHPKLFIQAIAKPLDEIMTNGVLLVIQDLTRVRQLEKIRSDFVSNVSHELRTPIASIKALADTLEEGALDDPSVAKKFLKRMNVEIDNLTQLVQELLELSKIESGRVPVKKILISSDELVNHAIERMQVQAERSGLDLDADYSRGISSIYVDPDQIGQVFVNLIHNAIKFTNPGGSIIIKTFENQDDVIFEIKDTGIGIEKDIQIRIFERFYKADKARSSGGTGLGLSIVKHIIEAHKGKVWVESDQGEGSSFYFSLPKNR
ncbi:MAG TPA: ATP-binding protein, partial [Anaerolineaceae bacterium]|nr:ATP-binding protein [Anaerolineaceae bacterium]